MAKEEATLVLKIKQTGKKVLASISGGLKTVAKTAAIAGTAIIGFVGAGVAAFKTQESAINSLNQSLVQQGIYTKDLSKKYQDMATSLQKVTTFGDEAIIQSQSQLQSYLGQTEVTEELMKSTLDFAAAMKVDLKTAADLVGKSVGSSTNALSRYGISIDAGASKAEKLAQVTAAMSEKFGGQSEAAADGLGAVDQLSNSFGDFMELVGKRVAPVIVLVSKRLQNFIENGPQVQGFLDVLTNGFGFVAKSGSFLIATLNTMGGVIGTVLAGSIESVNQLMQGNFSIAADIAREGMSQVSSIIEEEKNAHNERVTEIEDALTQKNEEKAINEEQLLKRSLARKSQIALLAKKSEITEQQKHDAALLGIEIKAGTDRSKLQETLDKAKESGQKESLSTIAGMQNSHNRFLATIGKAAALTQIAIQAPIGVSKALAAFPPPFNFAAATAVGAAFGVQAANVAGIQLAEGGIVRASAGGTRATIGEAGQDEAVIPLDSDEASSRLGGGSTFVFNGPILGDESQAREFAVAVDQQLLELRRNNESVSFDEGLI